MVALAAHHAFRTGRALGAIGFPLLVIAVVLLAPGVVAIVILDAAVDELLRALGGALGGDAHAASGRARPPDALLIGGAASDGGLRLAQAPASIVATLLALAVGHRVTAEVLMAEFAKVAAIITTLGLALAAAGLTVAVGRADVRAGAVPTVPGGVSGDGCLASCGGSISGLEDAAKELG